MREKVISFIREVRPDIDELIDINGNITEVLDSFDVVTLVSHLEADLGLIIPADVVSIENFATVDHIISLLNSLSKRTVCLYCGSSNIEILRNQLEPLLILPTDKPISANRDLEISICLDCAYGFASSPFSEEEYELVYENYLFFNPIGKDEPYRYMRFVEQLNIHLDKDSFIVEIGCSSGYNLLGIKKNGYSNCLGFEPSPQGEVAANMGLEVRQDYFTSDTALPSKVDAFLLVDVLEHFMNPFNIMAVLTEKLSDKGIIMLVIPNFSEFFHQHRSYFSRRFFHNMIKRYGLKFVHCEVYTDRLFTVFKKNGENITETDTIDELRKATVRTYPDDTYKNIQQFAQGKKELYIWGTGPNTCTTAAKLDFDKKNLFFIDSFPERVGKYIADCPNPSMHFSDLKGKTLEGLAVISSYTEEILQTAKENDIKFKNLWLLTDNLKF